jgi:hypothetical protein
MSYLNMFYISTMLVPFKSYINLVMLLEVTSMLLESCDLKAETRFNAARLQ